MSALGQKQTSHQVRVMSALPPKADIVQHGANVRFVPKADIRELQHRSFYSTVSARSGYAPPRSLDRDTTRLDGTAPAHNLVGNEFTEILWAAVLRRRDLFAELRETLPH